MPVCASRYFGELTYEEASALEFPRGLPGFEQERRFVVVEHVNSKPLVYLQSLSDAQLCFVALPVQTVDPEYVLDMTAEDRGCIGLARDGAVVIGQDVLCLALVSIRENAVTANLMAPVVASLRSRQAIQAISESGRYSHQHPLEAEAAEHRT